MKKKSDLVDVMTDFIKNLKNKYIIYRYSTYAVTTQGKNLLSKSMQTGRAGGWLQIHSTRYATTKQLHKKEMCYTLQ